MNRSIRIELAITALLAGLTAGCQSRVDSRWAGT